MKKLNTVYIGVGTNLGDKLNNIHLAYQAIQSHIGDITGKSFIYKTPPWGFHSTEDFYNSVIKVKTTLPPMDLLDQLQVIEKSLGKTPTYTIGYSSRLIDLDIIDYNNEIIENNRLSIPHSHIADRNFVIFPLYDVCPNWVHPKTNKPILALKKEIDKTISKVDS